MGKGGHNKLIIEKTIDIPSTPPELEVPKVEKDITTIHDAYEEMINRYGNHCNNEKGDN